MNQEDFFSPQKRKSCCSNGCNHHGYRACVHTQTKDYEYYSRYDSFYCKIKYHFEENTDSLTTMEGLKQPRGPTSGWEKCQTVSLSRLADEILSKLSDGYRKMSVSLPELNLALASHHVLSTSNKTGPTLQQKLLWLYSQSKYEQLFRGTVGLRATSFAAVMPPSIKTEWYNEINQRVKFIYINSKCIIASLWARTESHNSMKTEICDILMSFR